jgi:hypothetical protein
MMRLLILCFILPWSLSAQIGFQLSGGALLPVGDANDYYKSSGIYSVSINYDFNRFYAGVGLDAASVNRKQAGYTISQNGNTFDLMLDERGLWGQASAHFGLYVLRKSRFDLGVGLQVGRLLMSGTQYSATQVSVASGGTTGRTTSNTDYNTWGARTQLRYFVFPSLALVTNVNYLVYGGFNDYLNDFRHPSSFFYAGTLGQVQLGLLFFPSKIEKK